MSEWKNETHSSRLKVMTSTRRPASCADLAQRLVGLRRPAVELRRPPREVVVLGVRHDLRRLRRSQARPTSMTSCWGRQTSASTVIRSALTDHSSRSSRASVSAGFSPGVDRAARAERPAAGPSREPAGAAPGEPAAVAGPHDAQRGEALAGVGRGSAAAPSGSAASSSVEARRRPRGGRRGGRERPSCAGEPRARSAAIAASAACGRGGGRLVRRRRASCDGHLLGRPGAAREDAGGERHRATGYVGTVGERGADRRARGAAIAPRPPTRLASLRRWAPLAAAKATASASAERAADGGGGRGRGRSSRVLGSSGGEPPPPLLDPEPRARRAGGSCGCSLPTAGASPGVLALIVLSSGLSMISPFLLRDVLDDALLHHNDDAADRAGRRHDRDRDRHLGAERRADLHLDRGRPARDARPARRRSTATCSGCRWRSSRARARARCSRASPTTSAASTTSPPARRRRSPRTRRP